MEKYFSNSKIFLFSLLLFIFGIGIASFLPVNIILKENIWLLGIFLCLIFSFLFFKNKKIFIPALLALFLFLGIWRYFLALPILCPDKLMYYNGEQIEIIGKVCALPDWRDNTQKITLCAKNLSGKILLTLPLYPKYYYGDLLKIFGKIQKPEPYSEFAYDKYLARYGVYSVSYQPEVEKIKSGRGFYAFLLWFRGIVDEKINKGLPEPEASLASALILGDSRNIPQDLKDTFSKAGVSHIIAISGMHISVLVAVIIYLFLFFGINRRKIIFPAVIFIFLYLALIAFQPSAVRAGLMSFFVLLAFVFGRLNNAWRILVYSAFFILLINPLIFKNDIGFQLSFLAMAGMLYILPRFEIWHEKKKISKICLFFLLILETTLSAQIFTWPILAYNFEIFSSVSVLANLLLVWISSLLIFAVIFATALSFLFSVFSNYIFWPVMILFKYMEYVSNFLIHLPLAFFSLPKISFYWYLLYYFCILLILNFSTIFKQLIPKISLALKKKEC